MRKSNQKTFLIVWCGANNVRDKSKFEKIYKKVFSSLDNFFDLCYTNMNYYVKLRLIDGNGRQKWQKDGEKYGKLSQRKN